MSDKPENPPKTHGEIYQHLEVSAFKALVRDLNILRIPEITEGHLADANVSNLSEYWEARLDRFAMLVNQELHEFLTKRRTQITENPNRGRRRFVNYADRIEEFAYKLRTLILEAPSAISDRDEIQRLESDLEQIPLVLRELREVDLETGSSLGIWNAAPSKERQLRNDLILGIHALYSEYTTNDDWYTSNPNEDEERYSTPFFRILRFCYSSIKLELADSTIESDITQARASGNLEDPTDMSELLG